MGYVQRFKHDETLTRCDKGMFRRLVWEEPRKPAHAHSWGDGRVQEMSTAGSVGLAS